MTKDFTYILLAVSLSISHVFTSHKVDIIYHIITHTSNKYQGIIIFPVSRNVSSENKYCHLKKKIHMTIETKKNTHLIASNSVAILFIIYLK